MIKDQRKDGIWLKAVKVGTKNNVTFSAVKWYSMVDRCKPFGVFQKKSPTYIGCSMSKNFSEFQTFTDWHVKQVGYGLSDYQLDKDLLLKGNKIYSEDTRVLLPKSLNKFLIDYGVAKGVSWHKASSKFEAKIRVNSKNVHLGLYADEKSAISAYRHAKEVEALRWCDRLKAGEFKVDERVISCLESWKY